MATQAFSLGQTGLFGKITQGQIVDELVNRRGVKRSNELKRAISREWPRIMAIHRRYQGDAIDTAEKAALEAARSASPVKTGALRDSLSVNVIVGGAGPKVEVNSPLYYFNKYAGVILQAAVDALSIIAVGAIILGVWLKMITEILRAIAYLL